MNYAQHPDGPIRNLRSAEVRHLVQGAALFMRDPRQTPVVVMATDAATASFTVRVEAFEDEGVVWSFALWDVEKFAVKAEAPVLADDVVEALAFRVSMLKHQIKISCDPAARAETDLQIFERQKPIADVLQGRGLTLSTKASTPATRGAHDPQASRALETVLKRRGLWEIELAFVGAYASNPHAGEMVKAHRMILAELGLCPYAGEPLRDTALLEPPWSGDVRREHILTRLAFMRLMFAQMGQAQVTLYRAVYSAGGLTAPRNTGFVSTTFRQEVAMALFEAGEKTGNAALYMQRVPVERVFMTCLETPGLSVRYDEAEALLLFDPDQRLF